MQLLFTINWNDTLKVAILNCCNIEVMHKVVNVNKEMGLSVVMLHYPTFPDFKDLNVFALISVPLPHHLQSKHN